MPKADATGYAPVNGIKIYYEIYHAHGGDPVLLLHGGGGHAGSWGNQVPALMKTHRVIAIDSRGHGRSTRDAQPFTYHLMATDVLAVLDYLKVEKIAIVGHSDGGVVGLDLAINHSDRLTKLYLLGAGYSHAGDKPFDPNSALVAGIVAWCSREYARLSPTPNRFEDFFTAINRMWATEPNYAPGDLRRVAVPTCIAHAEHDEFMHTAYAEEMARLVPGAKFELLRGVSHFAPWQNPELFNRSVLAFLDGK